MPRRVESMRPAEALLAAIEGVNVTPPKVLQNIVDGFEILGPQIQPATTDPANALVDAAVDGKLTAKALDELLAKAGCRCSDRLL